MSITENEALWTLKGLAEKALQPFIRDKAIEATVVLVAALQKYKTAQAVACKADCDLGSATNRAREVLEEKP